MKLIQIKNILLVTSILLLVSCELTNVESRSTHHYNIYNISVYPITLSCYSTEHSIESEVYNFQIPVDSSIYFRKILNGNDDTDLSHGCPVSCDSVIVTISDKVIRYIASDYSDSINKRNLVIADNYDFESKPGDIHYDSYYFTNEDYENAE